MDFLKIAISMGCPAGIGPEIIVKALDYFKKENPSVLKNIVILGDKKVLLNTSYNLRIPIPKEVKIDSLLILI